MSCRHTARPLRMLASPTPDDSDEDEHTGSMTGLSPFFSPFFPPFFSSPPDCLPIPPTRILVPHHCPFPDPHTTLAPSCISRTPRPCLAALLLYPVPSLFLFHLHSQATSSRILHLTTPLALPPQSAALHPCRSCPLLHTDLLTAMRAPTPSEKRLAAASPSASFFFKFMFLPLIILFAGPLIIMQ